MLHQTDYVEKLDSTYEKQIRWPGVIHTSLQRGVLAAVEYWLTVFNGFQGESR